MSQIILEDFDLHKINTMLEQVFTERGFVGGYALGLSSLNIVLDRVGKEMNIALDIIDSEESIYKINSNFENIFKNLN